MDKRTLHVCKQQNNAIQVVNELPQSPREKRIDELALMKIAALEHIAEGFAKQNDVIANAIYSLAESIHDLAYSKNREKEA